MFGNAWVGVASAVLTLLILIFSEIIPKTLGAHYWRQLAPATAYGLKGLVWSLYPLVKLTEVLTRGLTHRITSYNVCYTKLLRIRCCPGASSSLP